MDSYAKFTVLYDTQQKYDTPVTRFRQHVDIPSSWLGVRPGSGTYRKAIRNVTALGTVETEYYGRKRVEYGKCPCNGYIVVVVQDGTVWRAVDRKPVQGCEIREGQ